MPFAEKAIAYTAVLSAATAVVATCLSYGSYQLSVRQAEISERSLVAANRNTEVAGLLTSLRVACDGVDAINTHFFEDANFLHTTTFNADQPTPPIDDFRPAILFSGPTEFPDPNRPEVLSDARALLDSAFDLLRRYDLVQLYLTNAEASDAESVQVSAPFKDFGDIAYSLVHQELSARDALENIVAAQVMCTSLPKTLAAWFRDSRSNKLGYILKLDDIEFRWARDRFNQRIMRKRIGSSHEERDEISERRANKRAFDPLKDGMFVRLPLPLNP
ncbi:hypothetical protein J2X76_004775 [Neorhizobium sp. 2083]|uniref:hypothetical protein n=1 Tax=Neorhizobium sp. 2083 TaxID=2817762 RepID=UPI002866E916|nr:hypothetical protein [Neorhizobium sp. 2083]MDR6819583.1 hypothetical protein [Neorhizobium sp. 2083]